MRGVPGYQAWVALGVWTLCTCTCGRTQAQRVTSAEGGAGPGTVPGGGAFHCLRSGALECGPCCQAWCLLLKSAPPCKELGACLSLCTLSGGCSCPSLAQAEFPRPHQLSHKFLVLGLLRLLLPHQLCAGSLQPHRIPVELTRGPEHSPVPSSGVLPVSLASWRVSAGLPLPSPSRHPAHSLLSLSLSV